MIISALKMLLDAMTLQLSGTVAEIDERNPIPLVKVQQLLQLMALVSDTIITAKHSNDTPDENAQIMHQLEAQFEAVERDKTIAVQWHPEMILDLHFFRSWLQRFF